MQIDGLKDEDLPIMIIGLRALNTDPHTDYYEGIIDVLINHVREIGDEDKLLARCNRVLNEDRSVSSDSFIEAATCLIKEDNLR